jgi:hypothetical protein
MPYSLSEAAEACGLNALGNGARHLAAAALAEAQHRAEMAEALLADLKTVLEDMKAHAGVSKHAPVVRESDYWLASKHAPVVRESDYWLASSFTFASGAPLLRSPGTRDRALPGSSSGGSSFDRRPKARR